MNRSADSLSSQLLPQGFGSRFRIGRDDPRYQSSRSEALCLFMRRLADAYRRRCHVLQRQANEVWAAKEWLATQCREQQSRAEQLERKLAELRTWAAELERSKAWAEDQRAGWEHSARQAEQRVADLQQWVAELERGKAWLEEQCGAWQQKAQQFEQTIGELRARLAELEQAQDAFIQQVEHFRCQQAQLDALRHRLHACRRRRAYRLLVRLGLLDPLDGE